MTENEYLEMPWRIEDTIDNLKTIKELFIATVLKVNLDGKGKQDAKEVEFDFNRAIQALEEIQAFEAIGTVEEFKALKEKNEPKKPFQPFGTHSYKCPSCWKFVAHEVDDNCDLEAEMAGWCPYCGQKIDWQ